MDSLIVLRKPLRKTQLEPKFIMPMKSKKAVPIVYPIPPNPDLGEESKETPISFVKLYKDLCMQNSIRATSRVHVNSTRVDLSSATPVDVNSPCMYMSPAPQFECPPGNLHVNTPESCTESSHSHTSLLTHYFGTDVDCSRMFTNVLPPSSARAELTLELDYEIRY